MDGKWFEHFLCMPIAAFLFLSQQGATPRSLKTLFSYDRRSVFLSWSQTCYPCCFVSLSGDIPPPTWHGERRWRMETSHFYSCKTVRREHPKTWLQEDELSWARAPFQKTRSWRGSDPRWTVCRRTHAVTHINAWTTSCCSCPRAQTSLVNYCQTRRELAEDPHPARVAESVTLMLPYNPRRLSAVETNPWKHMTQLSCSRRGKN